MADQMITVLFSCDGCGLVDAECKVRARRSPDEDVVHWVETVVGRAVQFEHIRRSLTCEAMKMKHLKIPMPPEDDPDPWIGKYTPTLPPKESPDVAQK